MGRADSLREGFPERGSGFRYRHIAAPKTESPASAGLSVLLWKPGSELNQRLPGTANHPGILARLPALRFFTKDDNVARSLNADTHLASTLSQT